MRWSYLVGFLILVGVSVAGYFWYTKKQAAEADNKAFAEETIQILSEQWDPRVFIGRAEPGLITAMRSQGQSVEDLFYIYKKLGALKTEPSCALKDAAQILGAEQEYTSVSYACTADYANGDATIDLTLRKNAEHPEWRIYYIHIDSPAFAH